MRTPEAPCCRSCGTPLVHTFVDLGMSPLSNAYLRAEQLRQAEVFFPLHVWVCGKCFLVQLEAYEAPEAIFGDYAYFSSYSDSWLDHCRRYAEAIAPRLGLGALSLVVEIASNDGYLLQYFKSQGIPVLGVEPAANVARVAEEKGIPSLVRFFGRATAEEMVAGGRAADLIVANNVLAHVPDLNDFVAGMKRLLKPAGTITLEFPHLLQLMAGNQFDTIYHEHFSYFSLLAVEKVLQAHGLAAVDAEELPTHGGSLRLFVRHADMPGDSPGLASVRQAERRAGLDRIESYAAFTAQVYETKLRLLEFLIKARREGRHVVGYGAAAKGNTLLNYCGIRRDFLDYVVDRSPVKQGRFLPGTHLPIHAPEHIAETRPDYLLILPWNIRDEVMAQMAHIREWGGRFVIPIPTVEVI